MTNIESSELTQKDESSLMSKPSSSRYSQTITFFVILIFTAYFFMIFLTNIDVGFIGDSVRYSLDLFIGNTTFMLPFIGLYWLLERYIIPVEYHNTEHSVGFSMIGFVLLVLGSSSLLSLLEKTNGGFWGLWTSGFLLSGLGFWGSMLVCVFLVTLALSLFISVHWRLLFMVTGIKVLSINDSTLINADEILAEENHHLPKSFLIHKKIEKDSSLMPTQEFEIEENKILQGVRNVKKRFVKDKLSSVWKKLSQRDKEIETKVNTKALDIENTENTDFFVLDNSLAEIDITEPILMNSQDDELNNEIKLSALEPELDVHEIKLSVLEPDVEISENTFSISELNMDTVDTVAEDKKHKIEKTTRTTVEKQVTKVKKDAPTNELKTRKPPPLELLNDEIIKVNAYTDEQLNNMGEALEENLKHFNIEVSVKAIQPGPVVTLFEIAPAPGVKVGQIVQLAKDLARSLVVASVRVVEVLPGKSYIGIEIPNNQREPVNFCELLSSENFQKQDKPLSIALGKDIGGSPVVVDLAKTPHLLVAGTTGSGKSVGINSMILSLLYKSLPSEVKMILIDPKMLELSVYEGIPHLITPVVTNMGEATAALKWAVAEMERRYKLMSLLGVRNIIGYNEKIENAQKEGLPIKDPMYKPRALYSLEEAEETPTLEKMPYIVVIIDEFADLIMVVGKQIEELIARIAQKARAAGIHLILATQRPSVNVITGLIKANIPTRLSFQVSTKIDSRTILDQGGAEQLLGLGDMLYSAPGQGTPLRAHGAFVSDEEVHHTVDWLKNNHYPPVYIENLKEQTEQTNVDLGLGGAAEGEDELFSKAWEVVLRTQKASISRVQRELRIGYNRAARLIEEMEQQGLLSTPDERGNREILAGKTNEDE